MSYTSRETILGWLRTGRLKKATHVIIVCDTFSYEDYPVYVTRKENVREKAKPYEAGENMTRLLEVYALHLDLESQLSESRAFHYETMPEK